MPLAAAGGVAGGDAPDAAGIETRRSWLPSRRTARHGAGARDRRRVRRCRGGYDCPVGAWRDMVCVVVSMHRKRDAITLLARHLRAPPREGVSRARRRLGGAGEQRHAQAGGRRAGGDLNCRNRAAESSSQQSGPCRRGDGGRRPINSGGASARGAGGRGGRAEGAGECEENRRRQTVCVGTRAARARARTCPWPGGAAALLTTLEQAPRDASRGGGRAATSSADFRAAPASGAWCASSGVGRTGRSRGSCGCMRGPES